MSSAYIKDIQLSIIRKRLREFEYQHKLGAKSMFLDLINQHDEEKVYVPRLKAT